MKKFNFKSLLIIGAVATTFMFSSCGGKKGQTMKKTNGFQEIVIPCQNEGRSDSENFRADASSTSQNMQASREKALLNAKQKLASLINTKIKSVTDRYMNETTIGQDSDYSEKFETMTREVVNTTLRDVKVTCEKTGSVDNGKYQTFIALEVNKEALLNGISKGLSNKAKLKVDYDKMKYEKIFNEEMKKLEDEQNQ